jgi:hypothetical protein
VTAADLWHGQPDASDGTLVMAASTGMDGPWTLASTMLVAEDWLLGGLVDRRMFLSVSGATLAQAVNIYLGAHLPTDGTVLPTATPDDPLVDQIEASVRAYN